MTDVPGIEERVRELLTQVYPVSETEELPILDAAGMVLAEDQYASFDQPPFSRSPLDGYAVRSADISEASPDHPVSLTVTEEVCAGHVAKNSVGEKQAIRIMTGAPIPAGADCVVKQEDTDYGEQIVQIFRTRKSNENICFQGSDFRAGTCLLHQGMRLMPWEISVLASMGKETVTVYRRLRVTVLTTGDEIQFPGEIRMPGKIYDSNFYMLMADLKSWDLEALPMGKVGDDPEEAARRVRDASEHADIILTTGGVSVGKKDIMHDVFRILGVRHLFWKAALKPGSPTLAGIYHGRPLICLSGNPYGAAVNMEVLVKPVLAAMSRRNDLRVRRVRAVLTNGFPKKNHVDRYVRAVYENGEVTLTSGSNESGVMGSMCGCNALAILPAGSENVQAGTDVEVVLL